MMLMLWIVILIVLGVVVTAGFLLKIFVPEEKWGAFANLTSILSGIVTALSIFIAAFTYYDSATLQKTLANDSARLQKELAASSLYQEHMKISIEHPDLANAELAPKQPTGHGSEKKKISTEKANYEKYRWYVGHALYSFESILEISPDDPAWKRTFEKFIQDHGEYIRSDFPCNRYSEKLNALVKDAIGKECSR
jgi:hypothetical protein